ncbi:MAG: hypothetical protein QOI88_4675 [Gammaproteobacteria bacterium]|jgi:hypothetical protein|nr:hypothetical protein [Gammaproteobacteria bacterium]
MATVALPGVPTDAPAGWDNATAKLLPPPLVAEM